MTDTASLVRLAVDAGCWLEAPLGLSARGLAFPPGGLFRTDAWTSSQRSGLKGERLLTCWTAGSFGGDSILR